jgi:hypothetical protein
MNRPGNGELTALQKPFQLALFLVLELQSFHSLKGRISRKVAEQATDMVFTACADSIAIANDLEATTVMRRRCDTPVCMP